MIELDTQFSDTSAKDKQTQVDMLKSFLRTGKKRTADFRRHPVLWDEWRARMSDLRNELKADNSGELISRKINKKMWEYELIEH